MSHADHAIDALIARHPVLADCRGDLDAALELLASCLERGGKLLLCGNGGSAADAEHWAGELLKGFERRPPPLGPTGLSRRLGARLQRGFPAIPLSGFPSLRSAVANDQHPLLELAQLVVALGSPGDVLVAISTSGRSRNVRIAARVARARGLRTLALTGSDGGPLARRSDVAIRVPVSGTAAAQELHLPVYHALCRGLERRLCADPVAAVSGAMQ